MLIYLFNIFGPCLIFWVLSNMLDPCLVFWALSSILGPCLVVGCSSLRGPGSAGCEGVTDLFRLLRVGIAVHGVACHGMPWHGMECDCHPLPTAIDGHGRQRHTEKDEKGLHENTSNLAVLGSTCCAPAEPGPRRLLHPTTRQGPKILDKAQKY